MFYVSNLIGMNQGRREALPQHSCQLPWLLHLFLLRRYSGRDGHALPNQTFISCPCSSARACYVCANYLLLVVQEFQADSYWRNFKEQQHKDYMDSRREQNRIREMEVHAQRERQAVGHRGLNLLEKVIVDAFFKD